MTTTTCAYREPVTFAIATDAAFNQIRQYSTSDVAVTIRLLEAIVIATYTRNNKDRAALLRHADMIKRGSQEGCRRSWIERMWRSTKQQ